MNEDKSNSLEDFIKNAINIEPLYTFVNKSMSEALYTRLNAPDCMRFDDFRAFFKERLLQSGLKKSTKRSYSSVITPWINILEIGTEECVEKYFGQEFEYYFNVFASNPETNKSQLSAIKYAAKYYREYLVSNGYMVRRPYVLNSNNILKNVNLENLGKLIYSITKNESDRGISRDDYHLPTTLGPRSRKFYDENYAFLKLINWPDDFKNRDGSIKYELQRRVFAQTKKFSDLYKCSPEEAFARALESVKHKHDLIDFRKNLRNKKDFPPKHKISDWNDNMLKAWGDLTKFKMDNDFIAHENRIGRWSQVRKGIVLLLFEAFFGHVLGSPNNIDLNRSNLTFALLNDLGLIKDFINFKIQRSGNYNHGHKTDLVTFISILRPQSGWLSENHYLYKELTGVRNYKSESLQEWQEKCKSTWESLSKWRGKLDKQLTHSRDPFAPIYPILSLDDPMKPILRALEFFKSEIKTKASLEKTPSVSLALMWRNYLLISLLFCIPFREKHWSLMTYDPDNTGSFFKDNDSIWCLKIPYSEFKNHTNRKIFSRLHGETEMKFRYDDDSVKYLMLDIENYLQNYRSLICNGALALFPGSTGNMPKNAIYRIMYNWSRDYLSEQAFYEIGISGVHPFGPHAARHIVATAILKSTGSMETVANLLLDEVETVRAHYIQFLPQNRLNLAFKEMSKLRTKHMKDIS